MRYGKTIAAATAAMSLLASSAYAAPVQSPAGKLAVSSSVSPLRAGTQVRKSEKVANIGIIVLALAAVGGGIAAATSGSKSP